jgi:hypothetical protein
MSDEPMEINAPLSPELPADGDILKTQKQFSGAMTLDLQDHEIKACMKILHDVRERHLRKWLTKFNDPQNFTLDDAMDAVEQFENELKTEMAEKVNVLVSVDATPLLVGEGLKMEWLGVLPGGSLERYGLDHEQKEWEVKRANARDEDYLGQNENP